jgi:hypothetical protein
MRDISAKRGRGEACTIILIRTCPCGITPLAKSLLLNFSKHWVGRKKRTGRERTKEVGGFRMGLEQKSEMSGPLFIDVTRTTLRNLALIL